MDNAAVNDNAQIVEIFRVFPYGFEKVRDWTSCKRILEEETLDKLNKLIHNVRKKIVVKENATPQTFESYTLNKYGSVFGWELIPSQSFLKD